MDTNPSPAMPAPDLDQLLHQLREATPETPSRLADEVLSRLGPSAAQTQLNLCVGVTSCLAAVALAALIGVSAHPGGTKAQPPELTLLTRGAGPLASF